jgi:phospholipase C
MRRYRRGKRSVGAGVLAVLALAGLLVSCGKSVLDGGPGERTGELVRGGPAGRYLVPPGIHKIKHVIVVMQENRSFDEYFGTYPGADGLPGRDGRFTACMPDPRGGCTPPYHDRQDINGGGPHALANAVGDVNGGRMNGFSLERAMARRTCTDPEDPACKIGTTPDVMGYHTAAEIPNYWAYARNFVLQDHMFEPVKSWSLPDHLYMVSAWSARCSTGSPMSCRNAIKGPYEVGQFNHAVKQMLATGTTSIDLAWTDITWLLHAAHVSWSYFVQSGTQPDCANDSFETCKPVPQDARTPGIWNPLPLFGDVHQDRQTQNVKDLRTYYREAKAGTLPSVSWIVPSGSDSEHPPGSVHRGQAHVTAVINAAMESPDWNSTAIFLSWDDWGGFYDHVVPPQIDDNGYGLRVPGLVISPYAKRGFIDHQILSSDAYLKFIEDDFLGGARLDPQTDGRPDRRPDVRENQKLLGNLVNDFNFSQPPRPPLLLPVNPPSDSPDLPAYFTRLGPCLGCTIAPILPARTKPPSRATKSSKRKR